MESIALLGTTLGLSYAAGLRLHATLLAIGIGLRSGLIQPGVLPDALSILAHPIILGITGLFFLIELLAEKLPWLDSAWHSIHNIAAPLAAALIGSSAFADMSPVAQTAAVVLSGGVGLTAATGKTVMRLAAPEPLSKLGLSLAEDGAMPLLIWFALQHPILTTLLILSLAGVMMWVIYRLLKLLARTGRALKSLFWRPQPTS